jgi:NADH:ubiquinone oxidoreductase subunit F (NADH-binding)/(2Fe-2S) ferredoxin
MRISTAADLEKVKQEGLKLLHPAATRIMVGTATCCLARGAGTVLTALERETAARQFDCMITPVGCIGLCHQEPTVEVLQPGKPRIAYGPVSADAVPEFIRALAETGVDTRRALFRTDQEYSLLNGQPYRYLSGSIPDAIKAIPEYGEFPFYKKQLKLCLRNAGTINPERIEEYIAMGGYCALLKAVTQMSCEQVIAEVTKSNLRGRGGGGFSTGRKWTECRHAPGGPRYVLCNISEGDPGIGMHKSLLESDPHTVLEGLIIGGYAIGALQGYIYISSGYTQGLKRILTAIEQAQECGLLGENIFGSGFDFSVTVKEGGGAYVCGESTALMAGLEGRVGEPRPKYIHTAVKGLWDSPSNLNNVETWANIPVIIAKGAEWFSSIGTDTSKGTKVIGISGSVKRPCLVEVPMGVPFKDILDDLGGGVADKRKLKAFQTGGPSGGVLPARLLSMKLDYEDMNQAGTNLGSGGFIAIDDRACMVDIARYFIRFLEEESCGKCLPCREGVKRLRQLIDYFTIGIGTEEHIDLIKELAYTMEQASLCDLGKTAPNVVLYALRYFKKEFEAHMRGECPAGVCKDLILYSIDATICTACGACIPACPVQAITGERGKIPSLDMKKCIKCGACKEVCDVDAIKT